MKFRKFTAEQKLDILLGLFIAAIVAANLAGTKIADFVVFTASVGIFTFPVTFLITDIVTEVYGKKRANNFVYAGFFALAFVLIITALSVWLPPASRYENNSQYATVFAPSIRIIIASLTAFLIAGLNDIWSFQFLKNKTKGRFLWLRNNGSTIISQFIDTTIFMFLAFYMVTPKFTADYIFALIIPYWLIKVLISFFHTPLCYLGVRWLRNSKE